MKFKHKVKNGVNWGRSHRGKIHRLSWLCDPKAVITTRKCKQLRAGLFHFPAIKKSFLHHSYPVSWPIKPCAARRRCPDGTYFASLGTVPESNPSRCSFPASVPIVHLSFFLRPAVLHLRIEIRWNDPKGFISPGMTGKACSIYRGKVVHNNRIK